MSEASVPLVSDAEDIFSSHDAPSTKEERSIAAFEMLEAPGAGEKGLTRTVLLAAILAGLGGILFGYDMGVISGALLQLHRDFNLSNFDKELVVSLMILGAILASLSGGYIIDFLGRKEAIIMNAVIFVIGALVLCFATSVAMLLVGRIIVGFGISLSAIAEVVYIGEIAPPKERGMLVSLNEMGITLGILIAYIVNYAFITTEGGWRYMFGLSIVPAVVQGVGMMFLPNSPRWLLLKHRTHDAREALQRIREQSADAVADEIATIQGAIRAQRSIPLRDFLASTPLRRGLVIGCGLAIFQQFTGQANVLYYGSTLFKAAGFNTDRDASLANIIIGVVKVLATIIALTKVDSMGRRSLLLYGAAIMAVCLIVLASVTVGNEAAAATNNSTAGNHSANFTRRDDLSVFSLDEDFRVRRNTEVEFSNGAVKWVSIASLGVFVIAYAFSFGPVSWLLLSEIFPDDARGRAISIATVFNWSGNLAVSFSFLSALESLGFSTTFFIYAGISVLAFVFIYSYVPETRERTLEEITALLGPSAASPGRSCLPWKQRAPSYEPVPV